MPVSGVVSRRVPYGAEVEEELTKFKQAAFNFETLADVYSAWENTFAADVALAEQSNDYTYPHIERMINFLKDHELDKVFRYIKKEMVDNGTPLYKSPSIKEFLAKKDFSQAKCQGVFSQFRRTSCIALSDMFPYEKMTGSYFILGLLLGSLGVSALLAGAPGSNPGENNVRAPGSAPSENNMGAPLDQSGDAKFIAAAVVTAGLGLFLIGNFVRAYTQVRADGRDL